MIVTFEQEYLRELYEEGKASDKKAPLPAADSQKVRAYD